MLSRRINGTGVPAVTTDFQFAASQVPIECVKTVTAAATQAVKTIEVSLLLHICSWCCVWY